MPGLVRINTDDDAASLASTSSPMPGAAASWSRLICV
jgi:hypothetical protein